MDTVREREEKIKFAIEIAIKLGLLAVVIYFTYLIAKPFIPIVVWGIIIAVAIAPLIDSMEKRFSNRKWVIIGFTIVVMAAMLVPTYMLSGKVIDSSHGIMQTIKEGNITIPHPTEEVKEWPLIGKKSYELWDSAATNLRETLKPFSEEIKNTAKYIFSAVGSGLATIFMFVGSLFIAAIFLLASEKSIKFYKNISRRLLGDNGTEWAHVSALTVRSVVNGVIGVAVIQATLALIGMGLMGVPFALVWAVIIMFLTIIQIPASLVTLPVIAYVFSQGSGTAEIIFAIYMLIVGASDGVLKPLMMGRGVDIPMLVILIGAIGGMILMGMIGLFVGAVIFALAYTLFGFWIKDEENENTSENA